MRCPGLDGVLCGIHDMKLLGRHNYENVMAAALMALAAGLPAESVRQTIRTFNAVEHRIEFVAEKDGVVYYNDSKGTNPDASIKAVEAMVRPTVLIAGGYDKGGEFDEFLLAGREKVRSLILLGATAEKIEQTARRCGMTRILRVGSLEEAVDLAKKEAVPGDAVLLSPACASWDMFKNYEVRGRLFKELVRGEG